MLARDLRKQGIKSEIILWKKISRKVLGVEFHRQVPLLEYIVDFYCHELRLAIEIDGLTHSFDDVIQNDIIRQQELEAYDVTFLRFSATEMHNNLEGVIISIENKIEELRNKL